MRDMKRAQSSTEQQIKASHHNRGRYKRVDMLHLDGRERGNNHRNVLFEQDSDSGVDSKDEAV